MPNVKVGDNVIIENSIIAENTVIGDNCYIGCNGHAEGEVPAPQKGSDITVIGENMVMPAGFRLEKGSMIDVDNYKSFQKVV
jgi:glucose-1-phosphate adenylyltransferase